MDITRWSILKSDLIIFFATEDGEFLYSQQKQDLDLSDCGSDHELLIRKFRLNLKKVGKNTRPLMYDLNQSLMIIQWR